MGVVQAMGSDWWWVAARGCAQALGCWRSGGVSAYTYIDICEYVGFCGIPALWESGAGGTSALAGNPALGDSAHTYIDICESVGFWGNPALAGNPALCGIPAFPGTHRNLALWRIPARGGGLTGIPGATLIGWSLGS